MEEYEVELIFDSPSYQQYVGHKKNHKKQNFQFQKICCHDSFDAKRTIEEVKKYSTISNNSKYLLSIVDYFIDDFDSVVILSPKCDTNLGLEIEQLKQEFPFETLIDYFFEIASGLAFLHSHEITHGCFSLNQIFITKNGLVLAGFFLNTSMLTREFFMKQIDDLTESKDEDTSYQSDIFSLGCLFIELLTLKPHQPTKKLKLEKKYNLDFVNLIYEMIDLNPRKRPSIKDVVKRLKSFKPNLKFKFEDLSQEEFLEICSFLTPEFVIKSILTLNEKYMKKCHDTNMWKLYVSKFTYFPVDLNYINSYNFEFFFRLKKKLTIQKNEVFNGVYSKSMETLSKGVEFIRVLNLNSNPMNCVLLISTKNLTKNFNEKNVLKYKRDGIVEGISKEILENRLKNENEKIYYQWLKGDVLNIVVNFNKFEVVFYINDDIEKNLKISNVEELKSKSPIHLLVKTDSVHFLSNFKKQQDLVLKPVSVLKISKDWISVSKFDLTIWFNIFHFLDRVELLKFELISKRFQEITSKYWDKTIKSKISSFNLLSKKQIYFKILKDKNLKISIDNLSKSVWDVEIKEEDLKITKWKFINFHKIFRIMMEKFDYEMMQVLLLTFRFFINQSILFMKLYDIYNVPKEFKNQNFIRKSIHFFIKRGIENDYFDEKIMFLLQLFCEKIQNVDLMEEFKRKYQTRKYNSFMNSNTPKPILPPQFDVGTSFKLVDFDTLELARQITIKSMGYYKQIKYDDFKNLSKSTTVSMIQQRSDQFSKLGSILVVKYSFYTKLIVDLFELNNFQDCFSLLSINDQKSKNLMEPIEKPQKRRRSALINLDLDESVNQKYDQILLLFQSRNQTQSEYQQYISHLKVGPCVPFFNMNLFQTIDKENKDFKISNEMINWRKRCLQFDEISKFLSFQKTFYDLKEVTKLMTLIEDELNKS